jgi:predicted esterase
LSVEKRITLQRTARYFLSNEPSSVSTNLCFVLHGYGQLPQFFLRKFSQLARPDILFVAPEGLHRFYLRGSQGRVGASWMTKEDRLQDIADYVLALDKIAAEVQQKQSFKKVALLGFSQGVATACRWVASGEQRFQHLINWAGAFPPDLDFKAAHHLMKQLPVDILVGDEDEFISPAAHQEHLQHLDTIGLNYRSTVFQGKHDVYHSPLAELMQRVFPV